MTKRYPPELLIDNTPTWGYRFFLCFLSHQIHWSFWKNLSQSILPSIIFLSNWNMLHWLGGSHIPDRKSFIRTQTVQTYETIVHCSLAAFCCAMVVSRLADQKKNRQWESTIKKCPLHQLIYLTVHNQLWADAKQGLGCLLKKQVLTANFLHAMILFGQAILSMEEDKPDNCSITSSGDYSNLRVFGGYRQSVDHAYHFDCMLWQAATPQWVMHSEPTRTQ